MRPKRYCSIVDPLCPGVPDDVLMGKPEKAVTPESCAFGAMPYLRPRRTMRSDWNGARGPRIEFGKSRKKLVPAGAGALFVALT